MRRASGLLCSLLVAACFCGVSVAEDMIAKEIIQKIDATVTPSRGQKRTLYATAYSVDEMDKQLIVYTGPARIKGDKILMLDDGEDIYFYTPRTDRVRHLASHAKRQKMMGSDFSYEDVAGGELDKKYTYQLLGEEKIEGVRCYKFELVPTESGPHYSKLILWADKERFVSIRIDYYDMADVVLKRLVLSDYDTVDGHLFPKKMVMRNLKEGGETVMETVEARFGIALPAELFKTRNLKRR
jgi:outer membrane lipoprotein-sorting protein